MSVTEVFNPGILEILDSRIQAAMESKGQDLDLIDRVDMLVKQLEAERSAGDRIDILVRQLETERSEEGSRVDALVKQLETERSEWKVNIAKLSNLKVELDGRILAGMESTNEA